MVNLILMGASGRMGQAVLKVLPDFPDLKIVADVSAGGDVILDFTSPSVLTKNLNVAVANKKPIVIGTTGYDESQKNEIKKASKIIPIVYSPNMSVGVNVMWKLIEQATQLMGKDYKVEIVETHHVHKKDAPSGTAKKMAEIAEKNMPKEEGRQVQVRSIREGEVVGDHTISFTSPFERLEIAHHAFSREVFAAGSLRAVLWIIDKRAGLYDMRDVIEKECHRACPPWWEP